MDRLRSGLVLIWTCGFLRYNNICRGIIRNIHIDCESPDDEKQATNGFSLFGEAGLNDHSSSLSTFFCPDDLYVDSFIFG